MIWQIFIKINYNESVYLFLKHAFAIACCKLYMGL